jgi:endonuclease YncB( thermonuclease family)
MNAHSYPITWPITRILLMRALVILLTAAIALSLPSTAAAVPVQSIAVTVTVYYDGERVQVRFRDGAYDVLRLKGVDVRFCDQDRAIQRTRDLTQNRVTYLELATVARDPGTNELVGYLWVADVLINLTLVSEGYATANGVSSRYEQSMNAADASAVSRGLGPRIHSC